MATELCRLWQNCKGVAYPKRLKEFRDVRVKLWQTESLDINLIDRIEASNLRDAIIEGYHDVIMVVSMSFLVT